MKQRIQIELTPRSGETVTLSFQVPNSELTLDAFVPPMQRLFNEIVNLELSNSKTSCDKGCSACCKQLIPLSIAEVIYLRRVVEKLPRPRRQKIQQKIKRIQQTLKQKGLPSKLAEIYRSSGYDESYFQLGMFCPFLEKGVCSIYDQRPFVCREYHVSSAPSICEDPYNQEPDKIKMGLNIGSLMALFSAKSSGTRPLPIPLFLFEEWSKEHQHLLQLKLPAFAVFDSLLNALKGVNPEQSFIESFDWKIMEE